MPNLQLIKNHNEAESGDVLVHITEHKGNASTVISYKVLSSNWVEVILHLLQLNIINQYKTTITLVEYDSPLRQRVIKKVEIS